MTRYHTLINTRYVLIYGVLLSTRPAHFRHVSFQSCPRGNDPELRKDVKGSARETNQSHGYPARIGRGKKLARLERKSADSLPHGVVSATRRDGDLIATIGLT
jgi:uncharacterized C2H2 Zn-finger protein